MIDYLKYKKWEQDENDDSYQMISIGYDPEMKNYFIKNNGFDLTCEIKIKYRERFAKLIAEIMTVFIGSKFTATLADNKFSWLPDWMKNEYKNINSIQNYLDKITWKNEDYTGSFDVYDINHFMNIFIDYSFKYEYQDIELLSIEKNFIIVISHHGNIWIITDSAETIETVAKFADKNGATVFPLKYLN